MPNPTQTSVHVDQPLTDVSVAFLQNASNFVSRRVFPIVRSDKASNVYYEYDRGDFNRDEAQKRAPGTESAGGGYRLKTNNFNCEVFAFHKDIPWQIEANADEVIDLENDAAQFVAHKMLIKQEKKFASDYLTTGTWSTDVTGTASSPGAGEVIQWNDDSADPIRNIRDAISDIEESTGYTPNVLTLGKPVFDALEDHPDIVDRIKYSGMTDRSGSPARVNERTLAQLFGLDEILVMRAIENTAKEGQTNSSSFIAGKNALLTPRAANPTRMTPSAGYTFTWTGYVEGMNDLGFATSRFDMEWLKSTRVEGECAFDQKLVSADMGYFWSGIVA